MKESTARATVETVVFYFELDLCKSYYHATGRQDNMTNKLDST
jgi:hypothetical protein